MPSNLEQRVAKVREEALANLGLGASNSGSGNSFTTRGKWLSNLRAIIPEDTRASIAGADNVWRSSETTDAELSRARSSGTQNAIRTAHDFIEDVLFRTGNVPFRVNAVGIHGEPAQGLSPEETQRLEENVEQHLDSRHTKCDSPRVIMYAVDTSAMIGPRCFHVYTVDDPSEPSGERPEVESVDPWSIYWDMDNDFGVERGEYFGHMKRMAAWRAVELAEQINLKSQKRYGANQIDMAALKAAIRFQKDSGTATSNIENGGSPDTDDILHKTRSETWDDLWIWVPESGLIEWSEAHPDCIQMINSRPEEDVDLSEYRRQWVMCTLMNGKLVGVLPDPGSLPYRMNGWNKMPGCRDWLGIADANSTNQKAQDGLAKALENDLKACRTILACDRLKMLNLRPEELLSKALPILDVNMGMSKNIGDVITALTIPSNADKFLEGLRYFAEQEDRDTGFPRIQQGQQSTNDNTAFELKQRLDNSGRHAGSKIRAIDSDIVWINARFLELDQELGNIELPFDVEIRGGGFRTFTKQMSMYTALMSVLQLAKQFPEVGERLQVGWALWELAEAQGVDPERLWISDAEYQKKIGDRQNSPEQQAQMEQIRLAMEKIKAATAKDNAAAEKAIADAEVALSGIAQADARIVMDRAKLAIAVANQIKNGGTRQDRRLANMEPRETVKKKKAQPSAPEQPKQISPPAETQPPV